MLKSTESWQRLQSLGATIETKVAKAGKPGPSTGARSASFPQWRAAQVFVQCYMTLSDPVPQALFGIGKKNEKKKEYRKKI